MRLTTFIAVLVQTLLTGAALVLSVWAELPGLACAGLGLIGAAALAAANVSRGPWRERVARWGAAVAWAATLTILLTLLLAKGAPATLSTYFDNYYVTLSGIIAGTLLLASRAPAKPRPRTQWRWLAMTWLMLGGSLWLGAAYSHDRPAAFYVGLLVVLALLVLCHFWFRLNAPGIVILNTLILLVLGLPVADLVVRGADWLRAVPDPHNQYYRYAAAKKDPVAFGRWWNYYVTQWRRAEKRLYMHDPDAILTYRLRPNSSARVAQSLIRINSRGFRGEEIPKDKGAAYRIVALGESTTFGVTLTAEDRPWPERLERMIRKRLKLPRPVEIINAGVPGYRLDQNLHRFRHDLLPLKPDLVISYHGINGFKMLKNALPPRVGARPPAYRERPLQLLADLEYRLKLSDFQNRQALQPPPPSGPLADPMSTPYAKLYRQLIRVTQTNHIQLVLATFSMAVNEHSSADLVKFYQGGYPYAPWQIQANVVHTLIVRQMAAQHPEVCLVDTQPGLDGQHDKFIDLVHLDPAGHRQLAETFFAALKPVLERVVK